ncbi:hypothetical protein ANO14919_128420 [Xylariales sp. No.14919]|nr:hypothetical protein ANO14919_128420 [Xylariales sp. No.14919]
MVENWTGTGASSECAEGVHGEEYFWWAIVQVYLQIEWCVKNVAMSIS